jgi:hypothetical protein
VNTQIQSRIRSPKQPFRRLDAFPCGEFAGRSGVMGQKASVRLKTAETTGISAGFACYNF